MRSDVTNKIENIRLAGVKMRQRTHVGWRRQVGADNSIPWLLRVSWINELLLLVYYYMNRGRFGDFVLVIS